MPKNQTPSVLSLKSAGVATPESLRQVSIMPERLKGWAMLTSGTPFLARGESGRHPLDDDIGTATRDDLRRRDIRTARLDRHIKAFRLEEPFVLRDIVARKLGLGDPFQLDGHRSCALAGRSAPSIRAAPTMILFFIYALPVGPASELAREV